MAQTNPLPERLKYLNAFRRKFASLPSEELDENAFPPLIQILAKRVADLPATDAEKLLAEDGEALGSWLSEPARSGDVLRYVEGVFDLNPPADLMKIIREETKRLRQPFPWVEMDLWPGVKPRRFEKQGDGGMLVKWKGLMLAVGDVVEDSIKKGGRPSVFDLRNQVIVSSVQFGEVKGTKYVEDGEDRMGRPDKRIIYVLDVPGGQVQAEIIFVGKQLRADWDEAPVESYFHTLRIVTKQSA